MRSDLAWTGDGVQIHYLDNGGREMPLLLVPGMLGTAEQQDELLKNLLPRRALTFSHRGLGRSQAITPGQGPFECRVLDIEAVSSAAGLGDHVVYAFSAGVPLAVAYAHARGAQVRGLILHDYEPRYHKLTAEWRDWIVAQKKPFWPRQTVETFMADSEDVDVSDWLAKMHIPVLLLRGAGEESMLSSDRAEALLKRLPHGQIAVLPNSHHETDPRDFALLVQHLQAFCEQIKTTPGHHCC